MEMPRPDYMQISICDVKHTSDIIIMNLKPDRILLCYSQIAKQ